MSLISKTAYVQGLQCPKLLWHRFNQKDALPEPDALTQAVFDQGHEVGDLIRYRTQGTRRAQQITGIHPDEAGVAQQRVVRH